MKALYIHKYISESPRDKTNIMACAKSENLGPPNLTRVFALYAERYLWYRAQTDYIADAQADLHIHWHAQVCHFSVVFFHEPVSLSLSSFIARVHRSTRKMCTIYSRTSMTQTGLGL